MYMYWSDTVSDYYAMEIGPGPFQLLSNIRTYHTIVFIS